MDGSSGSGGQAVWSIGGTVTGLNGSITLQNNGGDDITLDADGPFTFETPLEEGSAYAVTASEIPGVQLCVIDHAEGDIAGDVSDVLVRCGNKAILEARDADSGYEPWITDGTDEGTFRLGDLNEGGGSSNPVTFGGLGGRLVFRARTNPTGQELWSTDGTVEGTAPLAELNPGVLDANPYPAGVLDGLLYLQHRGALWVTDGQPEGIMEEFYDPEPAGTSSATGAAVADGFIAFVAQVGAEREPWVTDGTEAGTMPLGDLNPLGGSDPEFFPRAVGGNVYFTAVGEAGRELWVTDGTPEGTEQVLDIQPGIVGSNPVISGWLGDRVMFSANMPDDGVEPFISDGTRGGTVYLGNLDESFLSSEPLGFRPFGDVALFRAAVGGVGRELWRSDGTPEGTELLLDINEGAADGFPSGLLVQPANPSPDADPWGVFPANDGVAGPELWGTDGTADGTGMLLEIVPGGAGGNPGGYQPVGPDLVVFFANNPGEGCEPFITDGTEEGTVALAPINPGAGDSCN